MALAIHRDGSNGLGSSEAGAVSSSLPTSQTPSTATQPASSNRSQYKRPTKRRKHVVQSPDGDTEIIMDEKPAADTKKASNATANNVAPATPLTPAPTSDSISASEKIPILATADGLVRMGRLEGIHQQHDVLIGFIEECTHPTVIDGLCAVCGKSVDKTKTPGEASHSEQSPQSDMSRVTVSGHTVTVSRAEGQRMAQQDAERLQKRKKLSLVLDLDHTLVHATNDTRAQQFCKSRDDVRTLILPMLRPNGEPRQPQHPEWTQHFVKMRPHVEVFLNEAQDQYEIGVYTAGTRDYAEQICILLCRHLLGVSRDQPEMDMLRYRIVKMEQALFQSTSCADPEEHEPTRASESLEAPLPSVDRSHENGGTNTLSDEAKHGVDPEEHDRAQASEPLEAPLSSVDLSHNNGLTNTTLPDEAEHAGSKRKRVTFGASPDEAKSDGPSAMNLEKLKTELREAQALEDKVLELRQRLFGSRIVSRTDVRDLGQNVKSLKRIFPCGGIMAVVMDDREDVWANAADILTVRKGEPPDNLLLVRPYHWSSFLGFADVNNASGADLSGESEAGDVETDEQLLWSLDILQRVHRRFYESDGSFLGALTQTVPDIVKQLRAETLHGAHLVFSGMVPLHRQQQQLESGDKVVPRPTVIRYAETLGAKVWSKVTPVLTHVVAAKDGTDKILAARKLPGCRIVKPGWLMECVWSLTRREEGRYLLGDAPPRFSELRTPLSEYSTAKENSSSELDDDSEDDDLAAQFESELMEEEEYV